MPVTKERSLNIEKYVMEDLPCNMILMLEQQTMTILSKMHEETMGKDPCKVSFWILLQMAFEKLP